MPVGQFGKGCVRQPRDARDIKLHEAVGAPVPFDWNVGYDCEKKLGIKIPFKNQGQSESCVGNGWAYLMATVNASITGKYDEVSAKAIYSQIFLKGGGANIRDGGLLLKNFGAVMEKIVSSYKGGQAPNEAWMEDTSWITPDVVAMANNLKAFSIASVPTDIESWACAMRDFYGIVFGVEGENDGSWNTLQPKPPTNPDWGHCLFGGKALMINKIKDVLTPNSWGDRFQGQWQGIDESWFKTTNLFQAWTLIEKKSMIDEGIIFKDAKSSAIFLRCDSEANFKSMLTSIGKTFPSKSDGSVDWSLVKINGTLTIK